jgi:hypothetical protein
MSMNDTFQEMLDKVDQNSFSPSKQVQHLFLNPILKTFYYWFLIFNVSGLIRAVAVDIKKSEKY